MSARAMIVCRRPPTAGLVIVLVVVLVVVLCGGCRSGGGYRAASLPEEFRAPPLTGPHRINLSNLADTTRSSELIARGDVLEVTLATDYSVQGHNTIPVRVAEDGTANVALIGRVPLAGLELDEAEQAIAVAGVERGVFRRPHVTVTMKRRRVNLVTVIGAVKEPGVYEIPRGASTLLSAIVEAGGLDEKASTNVRIQRPAIRSQGGPQHRDRVARGPDGRLVSYQPTEGVVRPASSVRVDLVAATRQGRNAWQLDDGDVVEVERRDPQPIQVIGLVKEAGQFELSSETETRLLDALALAKGRTLELADNVKVIRRVPGHAEPIVIEASVREAKRNGRENLVLMPGDVVSVEETPTTMVVDALTRFVRVGLSSAIPVF